MDKFLILCMPARMLLIAGSTMLPASIAIGIALILIGALAYKISTYELGQVATVDKSLFVTWNNFRLVHIITLILFIITIALGYPNVATSVLLIDTLVSLLRYIK